MAAIVYPSSTATVARAYAVCSTSSQWGSAWTLVPDLHCRRLTLCTGEGISSAECYWRFGSRLVSGGLLPAARSVQSVNPRTYLQVIVYDHAGAEAYRWSGIWSRVTKGEQHQSFQAVGLESLLDLPCLDTPYIGGGSTLWAGRGLSFNQCPGRSRIPNRSVEKYDVNGKWAYVFQPDEEIGEYWTTRDAVELLLACAAPEDESGQKLFSWGLEGRDNLPDFDEIAMPTHGRSYLDLLRGLLPKSRLCGWTVRHDEVGPYLQFFTYAEDPFPVYTRAGTVAGWVPSNADPITISLAADQSANATLSVAASHVCDQVVVTGARRKIVCTLGHPDGSLDKAWADVSEDLYLTGASANPAYPPESEVCAREEMDRNVRASDWLRPVYCHFAPAKLWNQTAGNGLNQTRIEPIAEDDEGDPFLICRSELSIDERLPLLTGYEYDGDKIADRDGLGGHQAAAVSGQTHDHLPILVAVRTHTADPEDPLDVDTWVWGHLMARGAAIEQGDEDVNRRWSLDVRPLAQRCGPGLELRVQGEQQHVLAATEFPPDPLELHDGGIVGAIAWEKDLVATVCFLETRCVEVRFPENADLQPVSRGGVGKYQPLGDSVQRLYLEVPSAELVDVRPNTVIAIEAATGTLQTTNGGYVVDDRPLLQTLAERAYDWHSRFRYQLQYQTGYITSDLQVGQLVTECTDQAGTWPVGSVVTEITLEFPVGGSDRAPRAKCAVTTQFAEMDALRLL